MLRDVRRVRRIETSTQPPTPPPPHLFFLFKKGREKEIMKEKFPLTSRLSKVTPRIKQTSLDDQRNKFTTKPKKGEDE